MTSKIISLVLCLGVILALTLVPGALPKVTSANPANEWGFEIQPNVTGVGFNEDFTVNAVVVQQGDGNSTAWHMYLLFDPTYLEVTAIDTPSTLPTADTPDVEPSMPAWDNTTGWAQHGYSRSTGGPEVDVGFVYCTIHFRSKSATGTSYLNFTVLDPAHKTDILDPASTDVLNWTQVVNGMVMVGTPTLTVNVTPAGMGDVDITGASIPPSYPNTTTWDWDQNVTLDAVNSTPGWRFNHWSGDIDGPTNTSSSYVIMDDFTKNVTANFTEAPPAILADPSSLNFSASVGEDPANQTLDICNDGGHILNWTLADDAAWLSVSPTSGGDLGAEDCNSTEVAVDTTGLAEGTYHANITITAPGASNSPHVVPVTLNLGVPEISVNPTSLTFTTSVGVNPPSQKLEVCNSGTGTLDWELTDNAGWLSGSPTSGSLDADECEDVTVSVDVAGMEAGDYTATITITGSEKKVPVTLHIVSAMPEMPVGPASVSASGLSITPQQVQPGRDVTISISVANTGGETGSYNAVLYINGVVEDSQSVSVPGGTSKNVIFTVSKSQAGVYDVSLAGQSGQFEVVGGGGWFAGGLGTGGIIAIVVVVIVLVVAVIFILRGTARPE